MKLTEEFAAQFAEWQGAGGVEDNFEAHLVATGTLPTTAERLRRLTDRAVAAAEQVRRAVASYPFGR